MDSKEILDKMSEAINIARRENPGVVHLSAYAIIDDDGMHCGVLCFDKEDKLILDDGTTIKGE